jgi:hypothetical protein
MWAWAALLGGLAVVIAADLVSGTEAIERREFGRTGNESKLSARDQRALALARNFAAWHQAAVSYARSGNVAAGPLDDQQIGQRLPYYYRKSGDWRSVLDGDGTVRTDDGTTIAGIAVGGGALSRFLAAATGYAGTAGLGWQNRVAVTRADGTEAMLPTNLTDGHSTRVTLPLTDINSNDRNTSPP